MATVTSHRRYLFLKFLKATRDGFVTASAWDAKRNLEPGTALPTDFPARSLLVAYGYRVLEEIHGADTRELQRAGLTSAQAAAVLAAIG
jgi:hypothetical protein